MLHVERPALVRGCCGGFPPTPHALGGVAVPSPAVADGGRSRARSAPDGRLRHGRGGLALCASMIRVCWEAYPPRPAR